MQDYSKNMTQPQQEQAQAQQEQEQQQVNREGNPVPHHERPNDLQREMNARMAELVPELDTDLARTPLYRSRWYDVSEEFEKGVPCFIPAEKEEKKKRDYIWMPKRKDLQAGYYHLSTQESFVQAYDLFRRRIPRRGLRRLCKRKTHQDVVDAKIKEVLYNRFAFDLPPDDVHAARMKVLYTKTEGGRAKAFGRAAYLPALTSSILIGGFGGGGG